MLALTRAVGRERDSRLVGDAGGCRSATGCGARRAQRTLELSVVGLPAEDDEVIEEQGARVFLNPEAASLLDDKILDASIAADEVAFTIADQAEE